MTDSHSVEELQNALDVYLNGETGIRFEALVHFADPLFRLYQIDLRSSLQKDQATRTAEELATLLAILETARLLWAYLSLNEAERERKLEELERGLLGGEPSGKEERMDFLRLLSVMQKQWESMPPGMRDAHETEAGAPVPSFDLLLASYDPLQVSATSPSSALYGPDNLEPAEAQALFARPLLKDPQVLHNPDELESAMARAKAYWDLAQVSPEQYDEQLSALKQRFANGVDEQQIEKEAQQMTSRFFELFPEKQRS